MLGSVTNLTGSHELLANDADTRTVMLVPLGTPSMLNGVVETAPDQTPRWVRISVIRASTAASVPSASTATKAQT